MKIWFSIRWRRDYINFETFWSTKKENGNVAAGSHLIIVDDSSCRGATAAKSSNPKILNYYRQFLVKGFGDGLFEFRIQNWCVEIGQLQQDQPLLTAIKITFYFFKFHMNRFFHQIQS